MAAALVSSARTAADLQALAERLGRVLQVGDVLALVGPLGAGKTTFVQGVARGLGVPADRCLVIEDSERGLRAAKAAGLRCWVIPSALTAGGRFDAADAVLENLAAAAARLL